MKRILAVFIASLIILALIITGCASPSPTPAPSPSPTPSPSPAPAPVKPTELTVAVYLPDSPGPQSDTVKWWFGEVEKRSEGKIKFETFWGGSLLKPKEIFEGIEARTVDMGFMSCGHHFPEYPELMPGAGPNKFHYSSAPAATQAWWRLYDEFPCYEEAFSKRNRKLLWQIGIGSTQVVSKKPITKLADFKGLKSRSGGAIEPKVFQAAGTVPVSMPIIEAYDALSKNLIQVTSPSFDLIQQYKFYEVCDYLTLADVGATASVIGMFINLDAWNELPADMQQLMLDASKDEFDQWAKVQYAFNDDAVASFKQQGMEILEFDKGDWEKWKNLPEIAKIRDDYIADLESKGFPGQEINDRWLALENEMEAKYGPSGSYWK